MCIYYYYSCFSLFFIVQLDFVSMFEFVFYPSYVMCYSRVWERRPSFDWTHQTKKWCEEREINFWSSYKICWFNSSVDRLISHGLLVESLAARVPKVISVFLISLFLVCFESEPSHSPVYFICVVSREAQTKIEYRIIFE